MCWYFKRSQDRSFLVWTPEFYMMAVNSTENQNNNTELFAASLWPSCPLHKESGNWTNTVRDRKAPLDDGDLLSATCPHITSLGEHTLACLLSNPPASGRKKESTCFPNNFTTDQSNSVKLFQVCYAGGYYDHKENGNIRTCPFAQHPDELHLLSPVLLQSINSWGCQSHSKHCRQTARASRLWLERYIFLPPNPTPPVFLQIFFQKKKKEKAKRWPGTLHGPKIFDIQNNLKTRRAVTFMFEPWCFFFLPKWNQGLIAFGGNCSMALRIRKDDNFSWSRRLFSS